MSNNKQSNKTRSNRKRVDNKNNKKEKKSVLGYFIKIFLIFIVICIGCFSVFWVKEGFNSKKAIISMFNTLTGEKKPVTILILGVSTDISTELADTIMLVSYNPSTGGAYLLSIPRDTFIGISQANAKGRDKINSVYTREGAEGMEKKVEALLGINIDYYAVVKNQALIDMVDAVGGVDFDVPINMDYDDITQDLHIHLTAGMQKINGEKAEQLVRFRHNNNGTSYPASYGDNDFGRMRTQREFIKETVKQTAKVSNIIRLPKIISAIYSNIETNMSLGTIISYAPYGLGFEIESLENYQLPGDSKKCNSLWFYIIDVKQKDELINSLKNK